MVWVTNKIQFEYKWVKYVLEYYFGKLRMWIKIKIKMDGLTELNGSWLDENQIEVNLSLKLE